MGIVKSEAIELGTALIPMNAIASGTPDGTKFVRDDGVLAVPSGGGGGGDVTGDDTTTTVQNIVAYSTTGGKNITELTGTQGDILYHNGTSWQKLSAGTAGQVLATGGAGANPSWATAGGGSGDVVGPSSATDNALVRFDGTTGKLVQNSGITLDDNGLLSGTNLEKSILTIMEERPTVPSPYDDEFDGSTFDTAKWTFRTGSTANIQMGYSRARAIGATVPCFYQSISGLTNPIRIKVGFRGNNAGAYTGALVMIRGLTKWIHMGVENQGSYTRVATVKRYNTSGGYEADLYSSGISAATAPNTGQSPVNLEIVIIIDATNIQFWLGCQGNYGYLTQVARTVTGTLDKIELDFALNFAVTWFRLDRGTDAYSAPVSWAG